MEGVTRYPYEKKYYEWLRKYLAMILGEILTVPNLPSECLAAKTMI